MATNWDSSYKATPATSNPAGQGADEIRDLKENIELKISKEHEFDYSDVPDQGKHNEGSARVLVMDDDGSAPSRTPIVNDTEIGRIRVWKTTTGEVKMQYYGNDTAWEGIVGTGADLTIDTLTVNTSAGDLVADSFDGKRFYVYQDFYNGTTDDEGRDLYTAMSAYIADGEAVAASGYIQDLSETTKIVVSHISRTGTTISVFGADLASVAPSGQPTSFSLDSTNTTKYVGSIAF
jgi:hypothetical protein